MFPQFKKLNNKSGIVLFIVLMTAIIIMILSLAVLTQSVNEVNYAQQQIDQIAADQLAKGTWWNAYASGMSNLPQQVVVQSEAGRSYVMNITQGTNSLGITSYNVVANFDSFN